MVRTTGLNHVGIIVPDADASARWYVEKSGFTHSGTYFADGTKAVFVLSRSAGVMLELIQRPASHPDAAKARECAYIDHVAYDVEDPAEALRECRASGMDVIEGVADVPTFWTNGLRYVLVRSAGGEKVEYCKVL
jgi:catechol 2,3-dioxygenase-like lactoylglutathione lyase family enzyme